MRKIIKILLSFTMALSLVGCFGGDNENTVSEEGTETNLTSFSGSYYKMINLGRGSDTEDFYLSTSTSKDFETIGKGLQIITQDYLSINDHYMAEGKQLSRDDFVALQKRETTDSPYALEPARGSTLDGVENPIMIKTLTEQDYYTKNGSKYELAGISIAIILDPSTENNETLSAPMSSATIKSFSQDSISKLYKYIQTNYKKLKDVPLIVGVYMANDNTQSAINGNYIYKAECEDGNVGTMKSVNQKTVIYSSTEAEKLDPTTTSEFSVIKAALKDAATEAAGFVGEARYIDNTIQTMTITAKLNVKTYTELLYLTSVIADKVDHTFTQDFSVSVLVYSQDSICAVITKNKGESLKTTIL